ncbi:uncharacterized protein TNCV_4370191 [Trichonephila clavipes]|nr:uncharacterized protein TNCV_4370191 [Trichonephila clavipes]
MAPHKSRKPAPIGYSTDEEDKILYDIEEVESTQSIVRRLSEEYWQNDGGKWCSGDPLRSLCSRSSSMEEIGVLGIPLRSLRPTLHRRRVAGVSPLLSIGWWYLSSVSPKRHCYSVSAADKGCRVYSLDPRPDAVALYSGSTPGKCRAWFFAR